MIGDGRTVRLGRSRFCSRVRGRTTWEKSPDAMKEASSVRNILLSHRGLGRPCGQDDGDGIWRVRAATDSTTAHDRPARPGHEHWPHAARSRSMGLQRQETPGGDFFVDGHRTADDGSGHAARSVSTRGDASGEDLPPEPNSRLGTTAQGLAAPRHSSTRTGPGSIFTARQGAPDAATAGKSGSFSREAELAVKDRSRIRVPC